jgi:PilZ domain
MTTAPLRSTSPRCHAQSARAISLRGPPGSVNDGQGPEVNEEALTDRERRRNPRVTVPWPAIVEDSDGRLVTGDVIGGSLSGMKLRVNSNVAVGEAVKLRVTFPRDGGELEISAEVVRRDPGGIGVDFGKLPVGAAERVKAFVPTWDLRRRVERVGIELPCRSKGTPAPRRGAPWIFPPWARVCSSQLIRAAHLIAAGLLRSGLTRPVSPLRMNDGSVSRHA